VFVQTHLSPRDTADRLGVEPIRLIRLGRALGMASMDRRIPLPLVEEALQAGTPEERYHALVRRLLRGGLCGSNGEAYAPQDLAPLLHHSNPDDCNRESA
jgi:hypothetical protein